MSFRLFFACDINDCRNTAQLNYYQGPFDKAPPDWLVLHRYNRPDESWTSEQVMICPEHAKLFPKELQPLPLPKAE
jgi:hypothetical protein